ncbi:MAG: alkaline phosphatase D family protein [Planctomycetota bacterium]|nr:alkaline phosphatase D family protein [Planctomycetota bacterium]
MSIVLLVALAVAAQATQVPSPGTTTIAWGSCASDAKFPVQPIWAVMAASKPDAVVLLGDTPYIDSSELAKQLERRQAFFDREDVRALRAIAPFHCTWDDHDFGANDCDGRYPGKEHSREAFLHFQTGGPFGENEQGIYHSFREGPVEVFLLDTRWFSRTEEAEGEPGKFTLLGKQQWAWLERGLRASTAPFKVLACGMIWNDAVRPGKDDYWGAYRHERERLFRFLGREHVTGIVLVGGDIHRSRVVRHPTREVVGYEITELITSPLAQSVIPTADVIDPGLVWDVGVEQTCLVTQVTPTGTDHELKARFLDEKARELYATRILASHLQQSGATRATGAATFVDATGPSGTGILRASIYRPAGFDSSVSWPCLLFLHGMGECGTDGTKQLSVGLAPAILAHPERWPFVVIFPQKPAPEDEWEDHEAALLALLDCTIREQHVDPRRIAITGLSQGGHGAWELARRHPGRFVCAAPICGYPAPPARGWKDFDRARDWTIDAARSAASGIADALRGLPIWSAHGDADPAVPVEFTDVVVEALRARGATPTYERFAGVAHDAWIRAYGEPALAAWLRDRLGAR